MKNLFKLLILFFFILQSGQAFTSSGYELIINDEGYDLSIEFQFNQYQSVDNLRLALIQSNIISRLSPNILSVVNVGPLDNYLSFMTVKSFGIKSQLASKCTEVTQTESKTSSWKRECQLQTQLFDSGQFMISKSDTVTCTQLSPALSQCKFKIIGKTKPLKILGFQILNEKAFAVKAKLEALKNFFKLYYFMQSHNLSTRVAIVQYNNSTIKKDLDQLDSDATAKLKTNAVYKRSFTFTE